MCPVRMGVDPETTKAPKPVPAGWYDLKVKALRAKYTKGTKPEDGKINYEIDTNVVSARDPNHNDSFVMVRANNGPFQGFAVVDICHGAGLHIEKDGSWPGGLSAWSFDPKDPENVEKAQYKGPLLGRVLNAEVITTSWEGNERNSVKQIRCKVPDCAVKFPDIRHRLDLLGKNK